MVVLRGKDLKDTVPNDYPGLFTALWKLVPSDREATEAIISLLYFREVKSEMETISSRSQSENEEVQDEIEMRGTEFSNPIEHHDPPIKPIEKKIKESIPSQLEYLGKLPVGYPEWFDKTKPLKIESSSSSITSHPIETLFLPNWTRTILSSALSTYRNIGPIDVDNVVHRISKAEPIRKIPRIQCPSMVKGVQVLVDQSKALEPFHHDITYLKREIRNVAGKEGTQFLGFLGCPLWGVRESKMKDLVDYIPPSHGKTVLLLTDLGIARNPDITTRAGVSEWSSFADLVNRAGCSLIVFVPYPIERWPKSLINKMKIIQWDRKTSAITIPRLIHKKINSKMVQH